MPGPPLSVMWAVAMTVAEEVVVLTVDGDIDRLSRTGSSVASAAWACVIPTTSTSCRTHPHRRPSRKGCGGASHRAGTPAPPASGAVAPPSMALADPAFPFLNNIAACPSKPRSGRASWRKGIVRDETAYPNGLYADRNRALMGCMADTLMALHCRETSRKCAFLAICGG
jgi:hypothetical protein